MQQNHDDLLRQVAALEERFSHLHTRLFQVANDLQNPGLPPSERLLEDLGASRTDFIALSDRILALAESLAVPTIPTSEVTVSLRDLELLLRTVIEAEQQRVAAEQIRHRALAVLERVLALVHSDRIDFFPLLECQMKARDLYHAIADAPWPQVHADAAAVAVGNHPFATLLAFVEGLRELDDDRWTALHDAVAHAFDKALTVAAVRGKLHIQQEVTVDMPSATLSQDDETTILVEQQEPIISQVVERPSSGIRSEETATEVITQRDPTPPVAGLEGTPEQVEERIKGAGAVSAPDRIKVLERQQQPGIDGRVHDRVEAIFRVDAVNSRGEAAMGVARNVSVGGAFIEMDLRLMAGERMTITFTLLGQPFKVQAEVMRVLKTGFGVRFFVDAQQQATLREMISRL